MTAPRRSGMVTFGETMGLIAAVETGPLEFVRNFTYGIGGAESNVAIGVARLGSPATWFGRVGSDATGELIERRLQAEQVRAMAIRDNGFTGLMVKHRRFGTTLQVDYHRAGSAGSRLCPDDIPQESIETAALLHITGITPALSASARSAVFHAVRIARSAGVLVSADVNYRSKLWTQETARPVLNDLVAKADLVFAGIEESQLLLGSDEPRPAAALAKALIALGPQEAVIKQGARGCTAIIDGEVFELPALAVPVVDPVGAGDAFAAGYIAERLGGLPALPRLQTAIAMGAFAVSVPGDYEGLPRRAELDSLTARDVAR